MIISDDNMESKYVIIPYNIAIDNRVYNNFNNYYQLNFPFPFNFENLLFKENLN